MNNDNKRFTRIDLGPNSVQTNQIVEPPRTPAQKIAYGVGVLIAVLVAFAVFALVVSAAAWAVVKIWAAILLTVSTL